MPYFRQQDGKRGRRRRGAGDYRDNDRERNDRQGSYAEHKVLTSEAIQKVWIEATKRRKRNWTAMPYLLIKPKETCNEEKTVCTQNVEQDAGSDAKNACNTEQSKVKQSREFQLPQGGRKRKSMLRRSVCPDTHLIQ